MAYAAIEPFGEDPAFWRTGIIAATLANIHRKRGSQPFKPDDFMPKKPEVPKAQSIDEQKKVMMALVEMTRGRKKQLKRKAPNV